MEKDAILPSKIEHTGRPREWTAGLIEQKRQALDRWIDNPENYFFTAFLNEEGLHAEHIARFCQYSQSFRETHTRALQIQEQRIVEAALTRKFDGNFAKFVLQNKAGWREKSEVTGDGTNPLAIILDRIGKAGKDSTED